MQNNDQTFINAVINNDVETVKRYLKIVDPSANKNWAIWFASHRGYSEVVRLLLSDSRVDPSAVNNQAIRNTSYYGYTEVVRLLLSDPRVDPSTLDNYAIRWASKNGHIEVVRLLLSDPRVDFNSISNEEMKQQLLREKEERNKLRKEWVSVYRSIEKTSPQITYEAKQKSQIPKEIIKKTVYQSTYQELCETIHGNIPPVKLLALADLLKIKYDRNTSYTELCGKVKIVLLTK